MSSGVPAGEPAPRTWWKRRIAKLPVWAWLGLAVIVIAAVASQGGKKDEKDAVTTKPSTTEQSKSTLPETKSTDPQSTDPQSTNPQSTEPDATTPDATKSSAPASSTPPAAIGGTPADDVTGCSIVDENTVLIALTNNSSKTSSYFIDINYLDGAGQRIADESSIFNYVRAGEKVLEETYAFKAKGAATCEIAKVRRLAAESTDDIAEVTCEIKGVNVLKSIDVALTATNGSSKTSDYLVTATLTRDGVRVGTAFGTVKNVTPGSSAPGDAFTTTDGPADGVTCDVVDVTRTASN